MKINIKPKRNSKMSVGSIEARLPPITPPTIPKSPSFTPGFTMFLSVLVCLYAPLKAVGIIMAKLVPKETSIAILISTPIYSNKNSCKGTIRKPPPTPINPDANPATIPIKASPIIYSIVKMKSPNSVNFFSFD